jgi:biopolymer transport protein ExbD
MLRARHTLGQYGQTHIDMTPMVDCVMVLLIFLMVSSAFIEDPGIEVEKPDVGGTEAPTPNALVMAISNTNQIFFDGQQIQVEQVAPLLREAAIGRSPVLIIRADQAANHGVFSAVYSEAKRAGLERVQFATARSEAP